MPEIGEIRRGREIAKPKSRNQAYMWHACVDCGKLRWVEVKGQKVISERCKPCADKKRGLKTRRENNPQWKGGIRKQKDGYISIHLALDDPYFPMAHKRDGYIYEHRLIMANHLGRYLKPTEIIHHKNGIRSDNRIENLELVSSRSKHMSNHIEGYTSGYQNGFGQGYQKGYEDALLWIKNRLSKD